VAAGTRTRRVTDFEKAGRRGLAGRAVRLGAAENADPAADVEAAARRAASRSYLRRRVRDGLLLVLVGVAATVGAVVLIVAHQESGPPLFTVQITGLLGGPALVRAALVWLFALVRRIRGVRRRQWSAYPARSTSLGFGPVRWTVVGIDITPTTTLVIFPEQLFRSGIRRRVAREGQVLMLWPRRGRLFDHCWYAGVSGRPVFSELGGMSIAAANWWERRGLAALNRDCPR